MISDNIIIGRTLSENVNLNAPKPISLMPNVGSTISQRAMQLLAELGIDLNSTTGKIVACEMVMTASKSFFEPKDPNRLDKWVQASMDFARKKFGCGLIDAVLHLDEEVPHIHVIGVPVVKKQKQKRGAPPRDPVAKLKWEEDKRSASLVWTLSFDSIFGGSRERLSELQDEYHGAVKHLGLSRGLRNRNDKTITLGDDIEIDAEKYGRGKNLDGSERSRRNIAPQEYRQLIKQEREAAAKDAQKSRSTLLEIERRLGEAAFEAKKAVENRRSAEVASETARAE